MLKSMSIHQKDSKGIIQSNFVTSCHTFRGSIPTLCLSLISLRVSSRGTTPSLLQLMPYLGISLRLSLVVSKTLGLSPIDSSII